jgi:hypothetical protein
LPQVYKTAVQRQHQRSLIHGGVVGHHILADLVKVGDKDAVFLHKPLLALHERFGGRPVPVPDQCGKAVALEIFADILKDFYVQILWDMVIIAG